jgi:hypothetical protein
MKYATGFVLLLVFAQSRAQHPVIEISAENKPNEMSIAIDRKDPYRMVAGANINNLFRSNDGGMTWSHSEQRSPYGVWGDPVIVQDTAGTFFHFHLSNYEKGVWIDRIVSQRSFDGGLTFDEGTYFGLKGKKAQDKPWAVVDPETNNLYVTWTRFDEYGSKDPKDRSNIFFCKSADGGSTWSDPVRINTISGDCLDDDNTVEGAVPAVGPEGEIYVAWSGPNGLAFNRSFDGGNSWEEEEIKIHDHPGGWSINIPDIYRANGMPVTKCDLSGGAYHGRIYVNWADGRNGADNTDVFLSYSDDRGSTWSKPVRVNNDPGKAHQFFTWMDVDQETGVIWFVFHDRRDQPAEGTRVCLAWSKDGGTSFENLILSPTPFFPRKEVFFGDYNNIVANANVIRPVWTRLDATRLSVHTAIIDPHLLLDRRNEQLEVDTDEKGNLIFRLPGEERVDVSIYDLREEKVLEIADLPIQSGVFAVPLSNRPEGKIYTVVVSTEDGEFKRLWIRN